MKKRNNYNNLWSIHIHHTMHIGPTIPYHTCAVRLFSVYAMNEKDEKRVLNYPSQHSALSLSLIMIFWLLLLWFMCILVCVYIFLSFIHSSHRSKSRVGGRIREVRTVTTYYYTVWFDCDERGAKRPIVWIRFDSIRIESIVVLRYTFLRALRMMNWTGLDWTGLNLCAFASEGKEYTIHHRYCCQDTSASTIRRARGRVWHHTACRFVLILVYGSIVVAMLVLFIVSLCHLGKKTEGMIHAISIEKTMCVLFSSPFYVCARVNSHKRTRGRKEEERIHIHRSRLFLFPSTPPKDRLLARDS